MLFNSFIFILLFFPICLLGYFALNRLHYYRIALVFLIGMSLWFYGYFNPWYLIVIVSSVLINYAIFRMMNWRTLSAYRKLLMITGVGINIAILGYFKYMDFFISTVNDIFDSDIALLNIVLPLGISFFTFQQISFVVDAYKREVPQYGFVEYVCYVSYFPQLIAGPIVTHDELIPQLLEERRKQFDWDNFAKGVYLFSLGLAKKVLLADTFGNAVNEGYSHIATLSALDALILIFSYAMQIYFDFSGYCDMAIAIAKMMNIDLPVNFNSPYKAQNISEFWDRWHMTLTRFLTKYVYIPLGGNRLGKIRTYVNILLVFLISGIWHGAGYTFIVWGIGHGVCTMLYRVGRKVFDKIPKVINMLYNFVIVSILWVFFRADKIGDAIDLLSRLFVGKWNEIDSLIVCNFDRTEFLTIMNTFPLLQRIPCFTLILFVIGAIYFSFFADNAIERMRKFTPKVSNIVTTLFLLLWSVLSITGISTFLYFNF